jgi:hypothetical protein
MAASPLQLISHSAALRNPHSVVGATASRLRHSAAFRNPHAVLGTKPGVCDSGLKAAYRAAALRHHPDRVRPADRDAASRQFTAINEAYERLSGLRGRQPSADYHGVHPSLFWEVLGVHSNHFEGTVDHVLRAVAFRAWGSQPRGALRS